MCNRVKFIEKEDLRWPKVLFLLVIELHRQVAPAGEAKPDHSQAGGVGEHLDGVRAGLGDIRACGCGWGGVGGGGQGRDLWLNSRQVDAEIVGD